MTISFSTLTAGALGFALALAWNDAISKAVRAVFGPGDERAAVRVTFVYALVVTLLVILIVAIIDRTRRHAHERNGTHGHHAKARELRDRKPDCDECARHCGVASIVRFWEPPGGYVL
jgi:hypothetical protein